MRIVIWAASKGPSSIDQSIDQSIDREGPSAAEVIGEALPRLNGAESVWAADEKAVGAELARGCDVLIIADGTVGEQAVRRIVARHRLPVVVVAPDPAKAALALRRVALHEIAETDAESIAVAIRSAADASMLARVARAADLHPRWPPRIRRWMALTLRERPPYRFVKDAAEDLELAAHTISVHWGEEVGCSSAKEWLGWIQLVRAIECRRGAVSWTHVAGQLGITRRTLERIARQCAGCHLSELAESPDAHLRNAERYFATVLRGRG